VLLTIGLHEYIDKMPAPTARFKTVDPSLSDLRRKHRAEAKPSVSDSFMADIDATLMK
jgi:hypothetical protein